MSTFLVVAHQTATSAELLDALKARQREDRRAIFVLLVPATPLEELEEGRAGDNIALAEQAIAVSRETFEKEGIALARASVGDPDPLKALTDEFNRSRRTYDGIILCTLPHGASRWLSRDLPGQIEAMFHAPLTHVIAAAHPGAEAVLDSRVFTFGVRLGSRGAEIARLVAERLGYRYYDWEITSQAAERAGVPTTVVAASERAQSLLERVLDRLSATGGFDMDEPVGRLSSTTMSSAIAALGSRGYREFVAMVVEELAAQGSAVIVGHASQVILRDNPGAFKVLVTGTPEARAQRVALDELISIDEARRKVRESDDERRDFFKQTYGVDFLSAGLYDLTLNSDRISTATAAEAIITAASDLLSTPRRAAPVKPR